MGGSDFPGGTRKHRTSAPGQREGKEKWELHISSTDQVQHRQQQGKVSLLPPALRTSL